MIRNERRMFMKTRVTVAFFVGLIVGVALAAGHTEKEVLLVCRNSMILLLAMTLTLGVVMVFTQAYKQWIVKDTAAVLFRYKESSVDFG
jgi:hypothetical protein